MDEKLCWQGRLISVQPRIRLTRSFDQRSHSYLGYVLLVQGTIDNNEAEFLLGIGKAAQTKHQFRAGDVVSGKSCRVLDSRTESVEFYKTSALKMVQRSEDELMP
jgi:hypothetical protein